MLDKNYKYDECPWKRGKLLCEMSIVPSWSGKGGVADPELVIGVQCQMETEGGLTKNSVHTALSSVSASVTRSNRRRRPDVSPCCGILKRWRYSLLVVLT